ncbi:fibrinogen-binding adhesin SdrG C-terminal domain-containing protein [Staphylococcus chromogenes]|uniref:fibronectin-binding protein FnbA n=1 Tax=Staphylococcus chromogenes TaxID=46126 RepID=UPI000E0881B2|nr:fibrinogen-binding adhesin SdrG C-terminal domain-containing protein [Staphylococcus chromogenes]MBP0046938.1 fibrinogen-binding adhesin SdrG C-terminal domain-containing protein [Staphylococcus chromogenes]GGI31904.1 fibronectin-binding protein A [Staphylococcus chromogenes]SUM12886.1 fibronectin-binding protein precursor [Staphylococcus chromogenes]
MKKKIKQKHAIRKYKAGASSVLLGLFVFLGLMTEEKAKAAEIIPGQSEMTKKKNEGATNNETTGSTNSSSSMTTTDAVTTTEESSSNVNELATEAENNKPVPSEDRVEANSTIDAQVYTNTNDSNITNTQTNTNETSTEIKPTNQTTTSYTTQDIPQQRITPSQSSASATPQSSDMSQQKIVPTPEDTFSSSQTSADKIQQTALDNTSLTTPETTQSHSTTSISTGNDITQNVQIIKSEIEGKDTVNPHNAERVTLKYDWQFPNGMKEGDYFDFSISNNVNTHGISSTRKLPELKNGSVVMATGQLLDEHNIRYTFTDYIDNKVNVVGSLSLNLFIDPKEVTTEGKQTITSQLNGKATTKDVNIAYLNGINNRGLNINGSIEYINKETNTFKHIAYVNPIKNTIQNPIINGNVTSGIPTTGQPTVKVFEYIGQSPLNQSVYADTSDTQNFKDVTSTLTDKLSITNGSYTLAMNQLDKTYIITYEGQYMSEANELNFLTQFAGYPSTYPYYYTTVKWENGVVFYKNNGTGQGTDQPLLESNLISFTEDSGDGVIRGQYEGPMVEVEEDEYNETFDSQPDDVTGFNPNIIEEHEDSAPIDFEEDTGTEEITGAYNGAMEFEEESNYIDFIEDTTQEGMSGSNTNEVIEEVEENNLVEYEEDTTPEGMSGSNTNEVTEEVEENNLVEFEEGTTPEGMSGSNTGEATEEVEENNLVETERTLEPKEDTPRGGAPTIKLDFNSKMNHFNAPKTNKDAYETPSELENNQKQPLLKEQTSPQNEDSKITEENELTEIVPENPIVEEDTENKINHSIIEEDTENKLNHSIGEENETPSESNINDAYVDSNKNQDRNTKTKRNQNKLEKIPQNEINQNHQPKETIISENQPEIDENNDSKKTNTTTTTSQDAPKKVKSVNPINNVANNSYNAEHDSKYTYTKVSKEMNTQANEDRFGLEEKEKTSQNTTQDKKELPETGNTSKPTGLIAFFMALTGLMLVFRKRKKEDK